MRGIPELAERKKTFNRMPSDPNEISFGKVFKKSKNYIILHGIMTVTHDDCEERKNAVN